MSFSKLEEIRCPCGEVFEAELWNAINVAEDPDLKEALLCGEINVVCCPVCNEVFYAEHFLLYQDPASELLVFVYPASFAPQASYWAAKMKGDFENAMKEFLPEERVFYTPILLFGLDSLVELIKAEDEESDEASILEYLAGELGFSLIKLHPSLARPRQLPRVLPRLATAKKGDLREEVIAGLRILVMHNQHLTHYKKLLKDIEHDKDWKLDQELVKGISKK